MKISIWGQASAGHSRVSARTLNMRLRAGESTDFDEFEPEPRQKRVPHVGPVPNHSELIPRVAHVFDVARFGSNSSKSVDSPARTETHFRAAG